MATGARPPAAKVDGRKRRWHQHKVERRNELVDGTLEAIRTRGRDVSMDEIAAEIGVSKTVLYRYFVDKNDLTTAVMMRFAQTTLIPNMAAALSTDLDGYDLTREIIRVYVETVAAEPEIYPFVFANSSGNETVDYVFAGEHPLFRFDPNTGEPVYYLQDGMGSVIGLVGDDAGTEDRKSVV